MLAHKTALSKLNEKRHNFANCLIISEKKTQKTEENSVFYNSNNIFNSLYIHFNNKEKNKRAVKKVFEIFLLENENFSQFVMKECSVKYTTSATLTTLHPLPRF